jgi:hypothetical protein
MTCLAKDFDPGGGRAGAEARDARCPDGVRRPGHQRRLGADDDEIRAEAAGQRGNGRRIGDGDIVDFRQPGDPRVARRGVQPRHVGVACQRPAQRMLTAA